MMGSNGSDTTCTVLRQNTKGIQIPCTQTHYLKNYIDETVIVIGHQVDKTAHQLKHANEWHCAVKHIIG